jgi:hypothetical protein
MDNRKILSVVGLAPLHFIPAVSKLARPSKIITWIQEIPPLSALPASRVYDRRDETIRRFRRVHILLLTLLRMSVLPQK